MSLPTHSPRPCPADVTAGVDVRRYARALDARDARFDGLFFVGITTTRIYCRCTCPSRLSDNSRRRFFLSAAAAERAGFRPCLRCRPELAPGRSAIYAVSRLADGVTRRIAAGGLNGRSVGDLAREFGVSARHLRRALEREVGVSPVELAQTHRLLLAKRLLADTTLSITHVAYASGFQSLRRFNATFRERYRMPPSAVRGPRPAPARGAARRSARATVPSTAKVDHASEPCAGNGLLRLTLTYRAPFAWDVLIARLRRDAIEGVETVEGRRYGRTVHIAGRSGVVFAEDMARAGPGPCDDASPTPRRPGAGPPRARARPHEHTHLRVEVSPSLVPVLMPLLARLRHLFDLDAEPSMIDAHLAQGGLGALVRQRPGVRIPGALDGFDVVVRTLLRGRARAGRRGDLAHRVVCALGETLDSGVPALSRVPPTAERVVEAGAPRLEALGVPRRRADALVAVARLVTAGTVRLEPGSDVDATRAALTDIAGLSERAVTAVLLRALSWPDAFAASDPVLQRAAGAASARVLRAQAEAWRPWRAYAALHLCYAVTHAQTPVSL